MKKLKKVLLLVLVVAIVCGGFYNMKGISVEADPVLSKRELVTNDMKWTYLDDLKTDPNSGTWYEGWNKKNGWAYPLEWLDWGKVDMKFSDKDWKEHTGYPKFSTDSSSQDAVILNTNEGKAGPTYFFRHVFELQNPEAVKTIKVTVRYNDAMILYLNGKALESFFNIPTSNYKTNLEYDSQVKVTSETHPDGYIEETLYMEDVSVLVDKYNPDLKKFCIAAEIHCSDENDTDAFFELVSFELNPDKENLPETAAVKNIAVNVGEDEKSVNFAWYSKSNTAGELQIAEGTDTTGAFPEDKASKIQSVPVTEAYTKFYDIKYYSNKATFSGVEPGKDYIYRIGNADGWSKTYCLNTTDISDGTQEVIFLSDAQIGTGTIPTDVLGWKNTLDLAVGKFPNASFIANTGDFVDVATKESEYDAYFVPEQLYSYPTATAVGNHDIAANYGYHFNEPNMSNYGQTATKTGDYYFTYGNVLYMVLNTNNTNHADHVNFLEETSKATSNQDFDWKVVMFHQSIYASGKQSTSQDVEGRRNALVPVFDRLGIDIVLMGHDHCYARTHQMYNFSQVKDVTFDESGAAVDPEGTLYLTTSSASGSKYYNLEAEYEYLAARAQFYVPTFSHLTFTEDSLTMSAYRTDTMKVFDSYTIKKTVEKEDTNSLQANDIKVIYEELSKIDENKIIELSGAKVVNATTNEKVEGYTIGVNQEELKAIKAATEKGGSYELTITATSDTEELTATIKVQVQAKEEGSATSDTSPGTPSDTSLGTPSDTSQGTTSDKSPGTTSDKSSGTTSGQAAKTGDTGVADWMWILLASGFIMSGVYMFKRRKD